MLKMISQVEPNISNEDIQSDNVTLINGSWGNKDYSDKFIHELYTDASITIIPIKESLQPSGQSVALQSMSSGTPVIITKTEGFWAPNDFNDNGNILFTTSNELSEWENKIYSIINKVLKKKGKLESDDFDQVNYKKVDMTNHKAIVKKKW